MKHIQMNLKKCIFVISHNFKHLFSPGRWMPVLEESPSKNRKHESRCWNFLFSKQSNWKKTISNESYKMQFCNQRTFSLKVSRVHVRLSKHISTWTACHQLAQIGKSLEFMIFNQLYSVIEIKKNNLCYEAYKWSNFCLLSDIQLWYKKIKV